MEATYAFLTHRVGAAEAPNLGSFGHAEGDGSEPELPGQYEADADIRAGRVKRFKTVEDMIESLKRPW